MDSADILGFLYEIIIFNTVCHHSYIKNNTFTAQLRAGNILRSLQINNITVILQIIKLASPVRTHYKNINIILDDIADFLTLIFLDDNLICQTGFSDILNSCDKTVPDI